MAIAGVVFILTAGFGLREKLMIQAVPDSIKHAIGAGIGLLIALIELEWCGYRGLAGDAGRPRVVEVAAGDSGARHAACDGCAEGARRRGATVVGMSCLRSLRS